MENGTAFAFRVDYFFARSQPWLSTATNFFNDLSKLLVELINRNILVARGAGFLYLKQLFTQSQHFFASITLISLIAHFGNILPIPVIYGRRLCPNPI